MPPLYRADHVGSLLRPKPLLDARNALAKDLSSTYNSVDRSLLQSQVADVENSSIKEVVQSQLQRLIRGLTNGEYPRPIFYAGLFELLPGMTTNQALLVPDAFRTDFPTTKKLASQFKLTTRSAVIATSKITFPTSTNPFDIPYLQEWQQLCSFIPESLWHQAKITIPAPSYQHIQLRPGTAWSQSSGYHSDEEYFHDLAAAYTKVITTLYDHGCRFIQIDDPHLTYFADTDFVNGCKHDGTDPAALLDLYLQVYAWIMAPILQGRLSGQFTDLRIGIHLCRGNMVGGTRWVSGSYEAIARKLFNEVPGVDTYYLEFDGEHAGGFEPLRYLPRTGKSVVLGLVSTKTREMEKKEVLVGRVREAARVLAEAWDVDERTALDEALAVSPQCGFSSHFAGREMDMEGMWRKLALCRDVAGEIWGEESVTFSAS